MTRSSRYVLTWISRFIGLVLCVSCGIPDTQGVTTSPTNVAPTSTVEPTTMPTPTFNTSTFKVPAHYELRIVGQEQTHG